MPVLRRKGMDEPRQQAIDDRHDGIAVRDRQLAAGHEGRLYVYQAQDVGLRIDWHRHRSLVIHA